MEMTTQRLRRLATLTGLAAVGVVLARIISGRSKRPRNAALSDLADRDVGDGGVRPAGPEVMRDPPRRWTERDEASDESFPASDPSAKY